MTPDILGYAVGYFAFLFSLVIHENAHAVSADHFGDPTARALGRITMNPIPHMDPIGTVLMPIMSMFSPVPMLGWAKPVPVNSANLRNPVVQSAYVAAAGPISNLLLALACTIVWILVTLAFTHIPGAAQSGERSMLFFNTLFIKMIQVNCVLAIFNLVPIPPLDGHWILMRYLPPGPREALASIGQFGFLILLALMWTGILGRIIGPPIDIAINSYYWVATSVVRAF